MLKSTLAAISILLIASPAEAHWQWTKWGSSPAQLVAASKGTAKLVDPALDATMPFGVKEAVGTYESDGRSMRASFWFKAGKLSQVSLTTNNEDACFGIRRDLASVYGDPVSSSPLAWTDKSKGNRIQFVNWGSQGCDLIYEPLTTGAKSGL